MICVGRVSPLYCRYSEYVVCTVTRYPRMANRSEDSAISEPEAGGLGRQGVARNGREGHEPPLSPCGEVQELGVFCLVCHAGASLRKQKSRHVCGRWPSGPGEAIILPLTRGILPSMPAGRSGSLTRLTRTAPTKTNGKSTSRAKCTTIEAAQAGSAFV
jgi:hypothetical protein